MPDSGCQVVEWFQPVQQLAGQFRGDKIQPGEGEHLLICLFHPICLHDLPCPQISQPDGRVFLGGGVGSDVTR